MQTRKWTRRIIAAIDDGILSERDVLRECLAYMTERDVQDMAETADWFAEDEEDEDENS